MQALGRPLVDVNEGGPLGGADTPPTGGFRSDSNVMSVMGTGWTALRLQRLGQWDEEVCARFPKTVGVSDPSPR